MQKSTVWFVKNVCKKIIVFGLSWAMIGSNIAYAQGSEDDLDVQLSTVQQQIKALENELKTTQEEIKKLPPRILHAPLAVQTLYFMERGMENFLENAKIREKRIKEELDQVCQRQEELLSVMKSIPWANQGYTQNKSGYNYPNLGNSPRGDDSFGVPVAGPLFEDFDEEIPLEFKPVDENGNPISTDDDVSCKDDEGASPIAIPAAAADDDDDNEWKRFFPNNVNYGQSHRGPSLLSNIF